MGRITLAAVAPLEVVPQPMHMGRGRSALAPVPQPMHMGRITLEPRISRLRDPRTVGRLVPAGDAVAHFGGSVRIGVVRAVSPAIRRSTDRDHARLLDRSGR